MSKPSRESLHNQSSIALLQERFRHLQRAKQMREEKELSKHLTNSQLLDLTINYDPSKSFPRSELDRQPTMSSGSSSLRSYGSKNSALSGADTNNLESSDVDTSLHL